MAAIITGGQLLSALTGGAISSLDTLTSKRSGGTNGNPQTDFHHKEPRIAGAQISNTTAAQWRSLFTNEGKPSHGATPTTWANPTNTTPGGWMQANASGGRNLYLLSLIGCLSNISGLLLVYDRLGHMGGLSGTTLGQQNTNGGSPGTLTRYTGGARNFAMAEIYTAVGGSPGNLTMVYANQAGSTGITSDVAIFGGAGRQEAGACVPFSLALGDYGIQSVTSAGIASSTTTVGNWGVTIGQPLYTLAIAVGGYAICTSFQDGPVPQVLSNACVSMMYLAGGAAAPAIDAWWETVEV